jgi:hypothetical protein
MHLARANILSTPPSPIPPKKKAFACYFFVGKQTRYHFSSVNCASSSASERIFKKDVPFNKPITQGKKKKKKKKNQNWNVLGKIDN